MLERWDAGDRRALPQVLLLMYDELRRAASSCGRRYWRNRTISSTELLHEAYLALEQGKPVRCNDRSHFRAIVMRLVRQIASQHVRRKCAARRGGLARLTELNENAVPAASSGVNEDLEAALQELRRQAPRTHLFIEMHYRAGYSVREITAATGASVRTIERELKAGRTWLQNNFAAMS